MYLLDVFICNRKYLLGDIEFPNLNNPHKFRISYNLNMMDWSHLIFNNPLQFPQDLAQN